MAKKPKADSIETSENIPQPKVEETPQAESPPTLKMLVAPAVETMLKIMGDAILGREDEVGLVRAVDQLCHWIDAIVSRVDGK